MISNIKGFLKNSAYKTAIIFSGGNLIVVLISGVSGLLYGRWLNPEELGEFNKYGILTGYLSMGIILVDGAFQRHFPYYIGKGEIQKANEIAAISKWWYLALVRLGIIFYGILIIKAIYFENYRAIFGWLVQIPAYMIATYGLYLNILYRTNDDFLKLNKNLLISSFAGLILLPLVYFLKYWGLSIRAIIQSITNLVAHQINAPLKIKAKFDLKGLIKLAKVSLPLQIPSYLDSQMTKATISLVILRYLGEHTLGIYAMAITLQSFLLILSRSLVQIFNSKILLNYGSHDDFTKSFRYVIKPTLLATGFSVLIVVVFILLSPFLIGFYLPKYLAAIIIVQILSLELIFSLLRVPFSLFTSALMYREMIILRIAKVCLVFLLLYFFHQSLIQITLIISFTDLLLVIGGYVVIFIQIGKLKFPNPTP